MIVFSDFPFGKFEQLCFRNLVSHLQSLPGHPCLGRRYSPCVREPLMGRDSTGAGALIQTPPSCQYSANLPHYLASSCSSLRESGDWQGFDALWLVSTVGSEITSSVPRFLSTQVCPAADPHLASATCGDTLWMEGSSESVTIVLHQRTPSGI